MSPLEKAARALYEFGMMADCPTWDQFDERYKRDFFDMARAVLLAVRVDEPVYMPEQRFNDRIDAILEGE